MTTTSPGDPTTWVSEQGDTIATIDGKGFDYLGFDWVNIGNPNNPDHADFNNPETRKSLMALHDTLNADTGKSDGKAFVTWLVLTRDDAEFKRVN